MSDQADFSRPASTGERTDGGELNSVSLRARGIRLEEVEAQARRRRAASLDEVRRALDKQIALHAGGVATVLGAELWSILNRARLDQ